MQIKTIKERLNNSETFDNKVNECLKDGWILKKRYLSPSRHDGVYTMMIAEFVKLDPAEVKPKKPKDDDPVIWVKYFSDYADPLRCPVGDWIDLRSAETVDLAQGEYKLIRLGVGMILPDGYEALIAPRSSTYANFGIIQANSLGVIDNSYSGNNDEWHFPAIALRDTTINAGDRICQFRIMKNQPNVSIYTTDTLNDVDRGGIGSTGRR